MVVPQIDVHAAVAFASRFGLPNVMSFCAGACQHPDLPTAEHAEAWLREHPDRDVYFAPALLRDAFVGGICIVDVVVGKLFALQLTRRRNPKAPAR